MNIHSVDTANYLHGSCHSLDRRIGVLEGEAYGGDDKSKLQHSRYGSNTVASHVVESHDDELGMGVLALLSLGGMSQGAQKRKLAVDGNLDPSSESSSEPAGLPPLLGATAVTPDDVRPVLFEVEIDENGNPRPRKPDRCLHQISLGKEEPPTVPTALTKLKRKLLDKESSDKDNASSRQMKMARVAVVLEGNKVEEELPLDGSVRNKVLREKDPLTSQMSTEEQGRSQLDVYGFAVPVEPDPMTVKANMKKMDEEIGCLRKRLGGAYLLAENANRDYVTDPKLRIMFLRSQNFDPKEAAAHFFEFLEAKLDLWGADKIAETITFSNMGAGPRGALENGHIQILPSKDRSGRRVIFNNVNHLGGYEDEDDTIRVLWYLSSIALEDEEVQRRGLVYIQFKSGKQYGLTPHKRMLWKALMVSRCLPIGLGITHLCFDGSNTSLLSSFKEASSHFSNRLQVHAGTFQENIESLTPYGFNMEELPVTAHGNMLLDNHREWIRKRRMIESVQATIIEEHDSDNGRMTHEPPDYSQTRAGDILSYGRLGVPSQMLDAAPETESSSQSAVIVSKRTSTHLPPNPMDKRAPISGSEFTLLVDNSIDSDMLAHLRNGNFFPQNSVDPRLHFLLLQTQNPFSTTGRSFIDVFTSQNPALSNAGPWNLARASIPSYLQQVMSTRVPDVCTRTGGGTMTQQLEGNQGSPNTPQEIQSSGLTTNGRRAATTEIGQDCGKLKICTDSPFHERPGDPGLGHRKMNGESINAASIASKPISSVAKILLDAVAKVDRGQSSQQHDRNEALGSLSTAESSKLTTDSIASSKAPILTSLPIAGSMQTHPAGEKKCEAAELTLCERCKKYPNLEILLEEIMSRTCKQGVPAKSVPEALSNEKENTAATITVEKKEKETVPLGKTFTPTDHDVLMGRGKRAQFHEGNNKMRLLLEEGLPNYTKTSRERRRRAVLAVVDAVTNSGGRFLKKSSNDSWEILPSDSPEIKQKIYHDFRTMRSIVKKRQLKDPEATPNTNQETAKTDSKKTACRS